MKLKPKRMDVGFWWIPFFRLLMLRRVAVIVVLLMTVWITWYGMLEGKVCYSGKTAGGGAGGGRRARAIPGITLMEEEVEIELE